VYCHNGDDAFPAESQDLMGTSGSASEVGDALPPSQPDSSAQPPNATKSDLPSAAARLPD
jgi:hypothetical protein